MKHFLLNYLPMRNRNQLLRTLLLAVLMTLGLGINKVEGSHFMGGDITFICIAPNTYSITLKKFRDCTSSFTQETITVNVVSASCNVNTSVQLSSLNGNTVSIITPLCNPQQDDICVNGGGFGASGLYGVEQWLYRGIVTLPAGCTTGDDYVVSWQSCCRNGVITTGPSSDSYYIAATIDNTLSTCNSSPAFNYEPTPFLCIGQTNYFNHGITDVDGDSLVFSLTDCKSTGPNSSVNYSGSFSGANPLTTQNGVTIDPTTGQIEMVPTALEVGVLCVLVEEFRDGVKMGEALRDLQFTVIDCNVNTLPIASGMNGTADSTGFTGPFQQTACVGQETTFQVAAFDQEVAPPNGFQSLEMEWSVGISGATYTIDDTSHAFPVANFTWTPTAADVGRRFFTIRLTDNACPVLGVSVFTYTLDVVPNNIMVITTADTALYPGASVQLNATVNVDTTGMTYGWSPATGLSCTQCLDPIATPGTSTTYTFTISNPNNFDCGSSSSTMVDIAVGTRNIDNVVSEFKVQPNPFVDQALLTYTLSEQSDVQIDIFNVAGQKVSSVVNETQSSGQYQFTIGEAIRRSKGLYFVRMRIDGEVITKKIIAH